MTGRGAPAPRNDTVVLLALGVALAAVVLALYAQTASFEFLSLDDHHVLVYRPQVRGGLSWESARWALSTVEPNWHPVTWLSHMLDFTLFGADAGPHHLVNAGLHAANAVLLLLALRALSGELWPSALAAALFALHPLRAESVAWVTERKDTMSGLWFMLTLLAYAAYVRRPNLARYALVAVSFLLGLASKTMLVSLPLILLLLDWWPLRRFEPPAAAPRGSPPPARRAGGRRLLLEKVPLLAVVGAASLLTVFVLETVGGVRSFDQVSPAWRLVTPPITYVTYLLQMLWPTRLAVMYPHPAMIAGRDVAQYVWLAIGATLLLAAVTALCLRAARRRPYLAVGWLWYLTTLVPVIGILQVGRQWHADRFTYLPLIGIAIMIAWSLRDLIAARARWRVPALAATGAALVALAALSWNQIGTFRNSRVVFEHAVAVTDDNYFAHQTLGSALRVEGDLAAGRRHLEEALRISPDSAYALEQFGLLLEQQGDRAGAAAQYERAVALSWKSFYARRNLALIRRDDGDLDGAIALWTAALEYEPKDPQLRFDLGTALLRRERHAEAVVQLQHAVELRPDFAQAHNNLGVALAKQGQLSAAADHFERAAALQPGHPNAGTSLDWVRAQLGRR